MNRPHRGLILPHHGLIFKGGILMKTWLITGASSGIGYGIAQAVLEGGDKAIIAARSEDKLQALADRFPGQAQVLVLDVSDAGSIAQAMTQMADRLDDVDVLVNNAGYGYWAAVEKGEEAEIRKLNVKNSPSHGRSCA